MVEAELFLRASGEAVEEFSQVAWELMVSQVSLAYSELWVVALPHLWKVASLVLLWDPLFLLALQVRS